MSNRTAATRSCSNACELTSMATVLWPAPRIAPSRRCTVTASSVVSAVRDRARDVAPTDRAHVGRVVQQRRALIRHRCLAVGARDADAGQRRARIAEIARGDLSLPGSKVAQHDIRNARRDRPLGTHRRRAPCDRFADETVPVVDWPAQARNRSPGDTRRESLATPVTTVAPPAPSNWSSVRAEVMRRAPARMDPIDQEQRPRCATLGP